MKQVLTVLVAASLLGACSSKEDRVLFDGQYFRSKASRVGDDFEVFNVTVKPVSASFQGAREAGVYEATTYCVNNFGSSEIAWAVGPDTPPQALSIEKDTLVFQGRCRAR
ncbi:MAG: hypothetical protein ACSHWZ_06680 [Sulfitobacter sp.]